MITTFFLIVALVLFLVSAFNVPSRINLIALGLAFVVMAMIYPAIGHPLALR